MVVGRSVGAVFEAPGAGQRISERPSELWRLFCPSVLLVLAVGIGFWGLESSTLAAGESCFLLRPLEGG